MGASDFYCALCGGPFRLDYSLLLPCSDTEEASSSVTLTEQLSWLHDLRLIGRNSSTAQAFVSGPGTAEVFGRVVVQRGDDPDVPPAKISRRDGSTDDKLELSVYCDWDAMGDGEEVFAPFPLHCACWEVLGKVHVARRRRGSKGKEELDVEGVRIAMQGLLKGSSCCLAGMRYFELQRRLGEEIWEDAEAVRARIPWLLDPATPIAIDLPLQFSDLEGRPRADGVASRFAHLPTELLHQTLDQLSGHELLGFLNASPATALRLDATYWRHRISRDVPYLYEFSSKANFMSTVNAEMVDWKRLFRRVLQESHPSPGTRRAEEVILERGLGSMASRRRIWHCAEQLLDASDDVRQRRPCCL